MLMLILGGLWVIFCFILAVAMICISFINREPIVEKIKTIAVAIFGGLGIFSLCGIAGLGLINLVGVSIAVSNPTNEPKDLFTNEKQHMTLTTTSNEIYSIVLNDKSISGRFFLGSGTIDGTPKFLYYGKTNGKYVLSSIKAEGTPIVFSGNKAFIVSQSITGDYVGAFFLYGGDDYAERYNKTWLVLPTNTMFTETIDVGLRR